MSDIVTKAKNLGREYVIGHKMEKTFADLI